MTGNFRERIDELIGFVGPGLLSGVVSVDQVYAKYQHERMDLHHPRGGKARYLADPLVQNYARYLGEIANHALEEDGCRRGMYDSMTHLVNASAAETPVEFVNLIRSQAIEVRDNGAVWRSRPAYQHRLSEQELKDERRGKRRR
jgi:hypothetical protein